ncbi:MAG: hypothetical protein R3B90_16765 [Planctomycetaceae bacterium]
MLTPYEELEYLAEHLPGEGEVLVVTRQEGELHCQALQRNSLREGIEEVELYGRLVQANERLNARGTFPLWAAALGTAAFALTVFPLFDLGWGQWFLLPAFGMFALFLGFYWIRSRQRQLFEREIRPMLLRELMVRNITPHELMAAVRQHPEFRTLLDELVNWEPNRSRKAGDGGASAL